MKHDDARNLSPAGELRQGNHGSNDYDDQLNDNHDHESGVDDDFSDVNPMDGEDDDGDGNGEGEQVSSNEAVYYK